MISGTAYSGTNIMMTMAPNSPFASLAVGMTDPRATSAAANRMKPPASRSAPAIMVKGSGTSVSREMSGMPACPLFRNEIRG